MAKLIERSTEDQWWYKDAIIYELHVRAFFDGNDDGIGDFAGLIRKLDYLQDLGVTALWLLPFYPSPLRDDGYDIADYAGVHPAYGSLRDFRRFLKEAHQRGLKVITELVINHTSSDHPWFQRARRAPAGSQQRDFYVWTDDPRRYGEARIIFKDFEASNWSWDPVAGAYYWHRFYAHQPDLNFDNPAVQQAVLRALDHWLEIGVDGMRLDAVPYLFEREGTNCENLPETHAFLRKLRARTDAKYGQRMFLAEANQWPEDAAAYFGDGDECQMNFHFPVMPRMFMAVQMESRYPIVDILEQTPVIPESCQWALFLRNHDELTLEMVTDEDRDYMYRVYAGDPRTRINLGIRRRLAPLLRSRRKLELMNALLFSLPGTPVLYYGDEIGMGDNVYLGDRNGVRTPMQWSADRNAGFSRANPQRLYLPPITDPEYHFEAINVETQQSNPSSLLWWMKRLIALRKQSPVFGRGDLRFLCPENTRILAFIRSYREAQVLIVANLSRFVQHVELDLAEHRGLVPTEMFGRNAFPPIGDALYSLTLGPHGFYFFALQRPIAIESDHGEPSEIKVAGEWLDLLGSEQGGRFDRLLLAYVVTRRWFRGKARKRKTARIVEVLRLPGARSETRVVLFEVSYVEGPSETYVLPLLYLEGEEARELGRRVPDAVIARLTVRTTAAQPRQGLLMDALCTERFADELLACFGQRRRSQPRRGYLAASTTRAFKTLRGGDEELVPNVVGAEQSNTCVIYGQKLILKTFRVIEPGVNPDLEVSRYLTEQAKFAHTPPLCGALEVRRVDDEEPVTLAILQGFVANQGSAWDLCVESLDRFYERVPHQAPPGLPGTSLVRASAETIPERVREEIPVVLPLMRLLGQRTAELHRALGRAEVDPAFAHEPLSQLQRRGIYQSAHTRLKRTFELLRSRLRAIPADARGAIKGLLDQQAAIDRRIKRVVDLRPAAARGLLQIRCHGDFHLGQVLYTGKDFVIFDFEGEPARPISERRLKSSPLRDVAGLLRSLHYAAAWAMRHDHVRPEDRARLEPWAELWQRYAAASFLAGYFEHAAPAGLVGDRDEAAERLLDFYLVDKCVYELGYELNNRPEWVTIPALGLLQLLAVSAD